MWLNMALPSTNSLCLPSRWPLQVADDAMGRDIISQLQAEGIDTSHAIVGTLQPSDATGFCDAVKFDAYSAAIVFWWYIVWPS